MEKRSPRMWHSYLLKVRLYPVYFMHVSGIDETSTAGADTVSRHHNINTRSNFDRILGIDVLHFAILLPSYVLEP